MPVASSPIFDRQSSVCLLLSAESYYDCARLSLASTYYPELLKYIPGHKAYPRPAIYANACRAIELALKAHLRASGCALKEIRFKGGRNGHDLVCLLAEVHKNDAKITLSAEDRDPFQVLSEMYLLKEFDYPDSTRNRGAPSCEWAVNLAHGIIQMVTPLCRRNDNRHLNDQKTAFLGYPARVERWP